MKKIQMNLQRSVIYTLGCVLGLAIGSATAHERIVSATGNMSETIVALGLTDKLVADNTTNNFAHR